MDVHTDNTKTMLVDSMYVIFEMAQVQQISNLKSVSSHILLMVHLGMCLCWG